MKSENVTNQLNRIEQILTEQADKPMSFVEACNYLNISKSYLYKLTCKNVVPYYKPNGKKIFFSKIELDKWIFKSRIKPDSELEQIATDYTKPGEVLV